MISVLFVLMFTLSGCNSAVDTSKNIQQPYSQTVEKVIETVEEDDENQTPLEESRQVNLQIGDSMFSVTLEDNSTVDEFLVLLENTDIEINMSDYGSFEKVGGLGRSLTTNNVQTTTSAGDIVLYNGNQIVLFYGSNSWSYTRLGKIDNITGLNEALGSGDVTIIFSK